MSKQSFGMIGVGAFGAFAAPHLASFFDLVLHDSARNLTDVAQISSSRVGTLAEAASCDIVMIAVPVQKIESVHPQIVPHLNPHALVVDVASVKMKPIESMKNNLPAHVAIVGTHPLFGPQSGKDGIVGLNIAICDVQGGRAAEVASFCTHKLGLNVLDVTAEQHDRELAYVHGLTHMLGKVIVSLNLPKFQMTTKTYELIDQAVEFIRYDSEELFRAIERENPFAGEAKKAFFAAARRLEEKLDT